MNLSDLSRGCCNATAGRVFGMVRKVIQYAIIAVGAGRLRILVSWRRVTAPYTILRATLYYWGIYCVRCTHLQYGMSFSGVRRLQLPGTIITVAFVALNIALVHFPLEGVLTKQYPQTSTRRRRRHFLGVCGYPIRFPLLPRELGPYGLQGECFFLPQSPTYVANQAHLLIEYCGCDASASLKVYRESEWYTRSSPIHVRTLVGLYERIIIGDIHLLFNTRSKKIFCPALSRNAECRRTHLSLC